MLKLIRSKKNIFLVVSAAVIAIAFNYFVSFYASNRKREKILLIGLDAATWEIILPLIKEGMLPNIKNLMYAGSWGHLETVMPLKSDIIWTVIATGKAPQDNGVTNDLIRDPDTGEMVPPTSNLRKVKAIWNILSERNKRVGIFGWRVTWPAEKVNGVIISERAQGDRYFSRGYSAPPFVELCSKKMFDSFKEIKNNPALMNLEIGLERDSLVSSFAAYLLKNQKFDLCCLYLNIVDDASHHYWKYMFPEARGRLGPDTAKYKDAIKNCYIWCDTVIGNLLKLADKDTTVIIVSDHGFGECQRKDRYIFSKVKHLLEVAGLKRISHNSKMIDLEIIPEQIWTAENNIQIKGDLTREELNAAREKAIGRINNIKFKETGKPVFNIAGYTDFGFVLETKMFFFEQKPDYHILINDKEYEISDFLTDNPFSGCHSPGAIIIASGAHIRQNQQINNASVYDIVPTVLYLYGLPLAADMQGKVLRSILDLNLLKNNPVKYIDSYETDKKHLPPKPIRSPADEKIIKERMRSLGYIN